MIRYYFDVHIHGSVYQALTSKGVEVLRAQDDGEMFQASDEDLLKRATELTMVLVTQDKDFLVLAGEFQEKGEPFSGIIFSRPTQITLKNLIEDLWMISQASEPKELENAITFLPL